MLRLRIQQYKRDIEALPLARLVRAILLGSSEEPVSLYYVCFTGSRGRSNFMLVVCSYSFYVSCLFVCLFACLLVFLLQSTR